QLTPSPELKDLAVTARLGERLRSVVPRYEPAPVVLSSWLEDRLGLPIALESYGPTAADKRRRGVRRAA
ncbi:MAG: hypothetical protein AAGA56_24570, partial [Myxococcota bacterium]